MDCYHMYIWYYRSSENCLNCVTTKMVHNLSWATNTSRLGASLIAQLAKTPPAMRQTWVQPLGWEDPLEEGMATPSSVRAWRLPWTEEPGRRQSTGSQSRTWLRDWGQHRGFIRGKNRWEANEATGFPAWVTMRMTPRTEQASQSRKGRWWASNKALMGSPRNSHQA